MSEKDILELLKDPEHLRYQVGRLMSNEESEKETRRRRNEGTDKRLKVLEDDKVARDTVIKILAWMNAGTIITLIVALIKLFSK